MTEFEYAYAEIKIISYTNQNVFDLELFITIFAATTSVSVQVVLIRLKDSFFHWLIDFCLAAI